MYKYNIYNLVDLQTYTFMIILDTKAYVIYIFIIYESQKSKLFPTYKSLGG